MIQNHSVSVVENGVTKKKHVTVTYRTVEEITDELRAVVDDNEGGWGSQFEFIVTSLGYAVGLGNVWRFPYLVHSYGGGVFLIPYLICLLILAIPLVLIEASIGQFASMGPVGVWNCLPIFKGIGVGICVQAFILAVYYNAPIAWAFFYFIEGFKGTSGSLRWSQCGPWNINETLCNELNTTDYKTATNASLTEEFYYNEVLKISSGLEEVGGLNEYLVLYACIMWLIIFSVVSMGAKSLGKVAYFTSLFPYVMLLSMFIFAMTLENSEQGVLYYLTPEFKELASTEIWSAAVAQAFFSTGVASGGVVTLASYNKFRTNIVKDAIIIPILDGLTSFFAGLCVFAILGFMARHDHNIESVVEQGPGLIFIAYPEAISEMPGNFVWGILFFFMVCTLGLSSQFPPMETLSKVIEDHVECVGKGSKLTKIGVRFALCLLACTLGIIFYSGCGFYLYSLIDERVIGYPLEILGLLEVFAIAWIYGAHRFIRDIQIMVDWKFWLQPGWEFCWRFIIPVAVVVLLLIDVINLNPLVQHGYVYPDWTYGISATLVCIPLLMVVIFMIKYICKHRSEWNKISDAFQPNRFWGPKNEERKRLYQLLPDIPYTILGCKCGDNDAVVDKIEMEKFHDYVITEKTMEEVRRLSKQELYEINKGFNTAPAEEFEEFDF